MFRAARFLTNFLATILIGGFALWAIGFAAFAGYVGAMREPRDAEKTDAIIALTGGTNRLARALELLSDGRAKNLLISGVGKEARLDDLVKIWGYRKPLPDCCIDLGFEAENTLGNAREAREWAKRNDVRSLRLVTATYHMPRALFEFRVAMPDVRILSHPVIPEGFQPDDRTFWQLCFLEYHKLLMSAFRAAFYPADRNPFPQAIK
jgi:uncharacterized SAM-binding protein YcdF (DUF218 family)